MGDPYFNTIRDVKLFSQPVQVEKSVGDEIQMHVVDDDQFEEESAVLQNGESQISKGKLANLE